MTLFVRLPGGQQYNFVIKDADSCEELFRKFPRTESIFSNADSVEEAVHDIAAYLGSHHMNAWVENVDIKKSVKNAIASLGIAAATALTPNMASPKQSSQHHFHPQAPKIQEFGKQPEDKFLWSIMQVESSGGRNTMHPIAGRIHTPEERAIGKWGLLKPTVQEVIQRHKIRDPIPDGDKLMSMSRNDMEDYMKQHPEVELSVARALARHVIHRQKGDLKRSAYSWLYGHNKHYSEIQDQALRESEYVKKFRDNYKRNPFNPIKPVVVQVKKSEGEAMFRDRLAEWKQKREAETREPLPTPSNYAPDRGRLREKELDKKPVKNSDDTIPFLHQVIEDAKEGRKS